MAKTEERGMRRTMVGTVVSDKMDKTVVIAVQRRKRHPLYGKTIAMTRKFKAHDEENSCHVGDTVRVVETRPLSREKRWRVVEVIERAR